MRCSPRALVGCLALVWDKTRVGRLVAGRINSGVEPVERRAFVVVLKGDLLRLVKCAPPDLARFVLLIVRSCNHRNAHGKVANKLQREGRSVGWPCAMRGAGAGTVSRVVWSRRSNELKMQATRAGLAVNRLLVCLGPSKRAHAHHSRHDDRLLAHSRIKSSEECISRGPLDSSKRWQILREGERCVQMCLVSRAPEISGGGMVRAKKCRCPAKDGGGDTTHS